MANIMTLNELNESINILEKLDTVIENAFSKYELLTLTESGDEYFNKNASDSAKVFEKDESDRKKAAVKSTAKKAWSAFWERIQQIIDDLMQKIGIMIRGGNNAVYRDDITVSPYCFKLINSSLIAKIKSGKIYPTDEASVEEAIDDMRAAKSVTLKKGQKANLELVYTVMRSLKGIARDLRKPVYVENINNDANNRILQSFKALVKDLVYECKRVISNSISEKKLDKMYENNAAKAAKADARERRSQEKANKKAAKSNNESIDIIPEYMTRNEFIANLMLEAAELLKDDVVKPTEDQKDIEDIPEETPVDMDKYPTEVNGGADEKPDLEEIRDLCDGDEEVVKLLTDDEDKSVTVDSSNESAMDFFNMNF